MLNRQNRARAAKRQPKRGLNGVAKGLIASLGVLSVGAMSLPSAHADDYASMLQTARTMTPAKYAGPTTAAIAPKHLKVGVITCLSVLHGCVSPALGVLHAGDKLGWTVKIYDGGGTPNKQNAAILDAISSGANVIVTIAIDPNLIQLALAEAKKAGIPVVAGSNGIDTPNPVALTAPNGLGFAFDVGPDYGTLGRHIAQWMIADSHGTANIALFSDKEFPSIRAQQIGVLQGLAECPKCVVSKPIYFTATQIATELGQMTVGYLRNHPDVNYVFGAFDPPVAAQVTALMQAGMMGQVKVIGGLGNQQNLAFIRSGRLQVADAAYDNEYMGWAIVDQTIRLLNKQPLFEPHNENLPFVVLDKTNLPPPGADWQANTGYQAKFLALWK
ncbi:MAG TPA: sugar ABC transporter substrate-binding protein [Acidisoma sp.]|uniref:sugar ABC transporter substrate-binding protein n=1 Tax=Acidisoma sp. TaxID=1872115 RepID=UPI002CAC9B40|nr:sugar ABC transporter substrate-binding protein [Acidisoma sp.]HTI01751.1 sugar ABC transporter substrate-binding protein [Acidisoma sp.]